MFAGRAFVFLSRLGGGKFAPLAFLSLAVGGALTPLAFAPFGFWFLAIMFLAELFYVVARAESLRRVFCLTFIFAWCFFTAGLWWLFEALSGYIGLRVIPAALILFLFSALLSCFPAAALTAACKIAKTSNQKIIAMSAGWVLSEYLRTITFTGFPWLSIGYSQIPVGDIASPLAGYAPLLGVHGVGLAVALSAAMWAMFETLSLKQKGAALILAPVLFFGGWFFSQHEWTTKSGELKVTLLQGNVPQSLKWQDGQVEKLLADYLRMARAAEGRLIVLPETALPMHFRDLPPQYVDALRAAAAARNGAIVSGVFLREDGLYNGAITIGDFAAATYRKRHLTPFGEYLPFADILSPLLAAARIPFFGLSAGKNESPLPLLGTTAGVSICFEDAFGNEWRSQLPAAQFLLNLTNDAWFDNSAMLSQHLQISQARAAEFGRWLARATNTGATAIINHRGLKKQVLPFAQQAKLEGKIELRQGKTPYTATGDFPLLLLCALLLIAASRKK